MIFVRFTNDKSHKLHMSQMKRINLILTNKPRSLLKPAVIATWLLDKITLVIRKAHFTKQVPNTAWIVPAFGVILVRIFPYSDWIRRATPCLSVGQNNFEYVHLLRIVILLTIVTTKCFQMIYLWKNWSKIYHLVFKKHLNIINTIQ